MDQDGPDPDELEADLPSLAAPVDDQTILVNPFSTLGVLDGVEGHAVNGSWPEFCRFYAIDSDQRTATLV